MGVRGGPAEPAGRWQRTAQDREWEGEGQVGRGARSMLDAGTIAGERLRGVQLGSSEAGNVELADPPPIGVPGPKNVQRVAKYAKKV